MQNDTKLNIRDRRGDNRFFIDNTFIKEWGGKLGPHCIAVYSALAMHTNIDTQQSYPSFQTIADLTGMSRRQVIREVEKLKANNIIRVKKDPRVNPKTGKEYFQTDIFTLLHPDEWGKPIEECLHEGSDTQSLGTDEKSPEPGQDLTPSHYPSDTQSLPLVTGSHPNNKDSYTIPGDSEKSQLGPLTQALATVCKLDYDMLINGAKQKFLDALDILVRKKVEPIQLNAFSVFWRMTWKGKSPPTPTQVCESWLQFTEWQAAGSPDLRESAKVNSPPKDKPPAVNGHKTQIDTSLLETLQQQAKGV